MTSSPYILPFAQCDKDQHARVGGKCASLGAMTALGAPVPPGFAITTEAYMALINTDDVRQQIDAALQQLIAGDVANEDGVSQRIRSLIEETPLPSPIEIAIREAYANLCATVGVVDLPVAVRSSATAEDLPNASFAGQQDTYLWVVGADAVIAHVCKCWASLYTTRAIVYRHDRGFEHEKVAMAVAVQKMVNARAAGVAMTLNPINGDRSKVVIDASWGLGEAVVSGEVTPDNFVVDKGVFAIVQKTISLKHMEIVPNVVDRCTVHRPIEGYRQTEPCLTSDEVIAVAKMARHLEKQYKAPQDIEWALDADLPTGSNLMLLQSRPETVWSQKAAPTLSNKNQRTGVASVLNTIMTPVKVKNS